MHHMRPRSRGGKTDEFNLFPFKIERHQNWHKIFMNMTIREVWDRLEEIHKAIWLTDKEIVTRSWLSVCKLRKKKDIRNVLKEEYEVFYLREVWVHAFGGWELSRARILLRCMMFFMAFGSDMVCLDTDDRQWAFEISFPKNSEWQSIKSDIAKILR